MKTAIGYIRVSKADQSKNGLSLNAQLRAIGKYCRGNNLDLKRTVRDAGISAKNIVGRPGMCELLSLTTGRKPKHTVIVATAVDRLFRNVTDATATKSVWDAAGVEVHVIYSGGVMGHETPEDFMRFGLEALLPDYVRRKIQQSTQKVIDQKRERHEKLGGCVPYGYRVEQRPKPDGQAGTVGVLVEDEEQQSVIVEMLKLKQAGVGSKDIAQALTDAGIPTSTGKSTWLYLTVWKICKRELEKRNGVAV